MVSPDEGWAVGAQGTILHYSRGAWRQVDSPTTSNLAAVAMRNPDDGWIVGNQPQVLLHYAGEEWQVAQFPVLWLGLYDVTLFGDRGGLIVGGQLQANNWAVAAGLDEAGQWQSLVKKKQPYSLLGVSLLASGAGWAVGDEVVLRLGEAAGVKGEPQPLDGTLTAVSVVFPNEAWAVGLEGRLARYSEAGWQTYATSLHSVDLLDIDMVNGGEGWAVGTQGTILRFDSGAWYLHSQHTGVLPKIYTAVDMIAPDEGWIVGADGVILHFAG
jgi:photosystem II stability/assembly factor-like uncharacterized protein